MGIDKLVIVLKGLGLCLDHVIGVRLSHRVQEGYAAFNTASASYFPNDRQPARTSTDVTGLPRDACVEIDLVARSPLQRAVTRISRRLRAAEVRATTHTVIWTIAPEYWMAYGSEPSMMAREYWPSGFSLTGAEDDRPSRMGE